MSVSMPTKPPALDPLRSSTAASDERDRVREGDRHRESIGGGSGDGGVAAVVDDSSTCPILPTPKAK